MTQRLIRNIVFDIGWVFVRLNYRPLLGHLKAHGAEVGDRDAVMERIGLADHECGRLPGRGLLERLAALARQPVSLEEMHAHWVDMFELEAGGGGLGPPPRRNNARGGLFFTAVRRSCLPS